ncbi:MAG TPA: succinate dehydrogenase, hydrophobic membrane anchor protein [Usitatibacter sp.]|nr:succinate dehydrogenase, hydrophobic membrane anchor protein [Usitatibacter sp.]
MKAYRKNPVGAHYGLGDWLLQRLTAVVMALFTIVMFACLIVDAPHGYAEWKAIFSGMTMRIATMLFIASLLYHAWVGMRDIIMDYLGATSVRLTAQSAVGFALVAYLVWAAAILWGR